MSGTPVLTDLRMDGRDLVVRSYQDVEDIVERNKVLANEPQKSDWGRHVASIPNNILNQWLQEAWASGNIDMKLFDEQFNALIARKLRDHDWLFLRTG